MVTTGDKIREARKRRCWSAQEFASHMGVSLQTVYRWEWGSSRPPKAKMQAVALALGVTVASLVEDA